MKTILKMNNFAIDLTEVIAIELNVDVSYTDGNHIIFYTKDRKISIYTNANEIDSREAFEAITKLWGEVINKK